MNEASIAENDSIAGGEVDDEEEDTSKVCSECSQKFETEWTLRTHYTLSNEGEKSHYCIPCRIELPTTCSYKAHIRLHSLSEPYTCPDCGLVMDKKTIFLKHIRLQCMHYSKVRI